MIHESNDNWRDNYEEWFIFVHVYTKVKSTGSIEPQLYYLLRLFLHLLQRQTANFQSPNV